MGTELRATIAGIVLLTLAAGPGCANTRPRSDLPYRFVAKVQAPVVPPLGLLFSRVTIPTVVAPTDFGSRKGEATTSRIGLPPLPRPGFETGINFVRWGDASFEAAARDGGITRVKHADRRVQTFLFVFTQETTELYGD